ncbi:hypothetical protein Tco_1226493 [Tanacetum coccineum]
MIITNSVVDGGSWSIVIKKISALALDLIYKDKMIWCGEVLQKGRPKLGAPSPLRPPHPSQHHHHRCHHQMTHYHKKLLLNRNGSMVEADPPLVPLAPHQKLTGISMARN